MEFADDRFPRYKINPKHRRDKQNTYERSLSQPLLETRMIASYSCTIPHCLNTILLLLINVMNIKENVLTTSLLDWC